jgi:hypothetical protein
MKAIDFIAPATHALQIDELTFQVSPMRMGELPALVIAVEPMLTELYFLQEAQAITTDRMFSLAATFGADMLQAVTIMARSERKVIDNLLLDRFVALAVLCVEVNRDFFTKALPHTLAQMHPLIPGLARAMVRTGLAPNAAAQDLAPAPAPTPETGQPPAMS